MSHSWQPHCKTVQIYNLYVSIVNHIQKGFECGQVPEMQRSELAGSVLQLKSLGIDNILNFNFLSPPPAEAMIRALELLYALGALDDDARRVFWIY